ncbi:MAG TPA: transcription termination/antitermination protein NusA [Anaerolineae bacterium]|nr:transcription termination/antitermination protein NusA [Anaerolineae bacterium]
MKNELVLAFNEVLEDKGLPKEIIMDALAAAMVSAYRKSVNASSAQEIKAEIDLDSGNLKILVEKEVVEDVQEVHTEVTLQEASRFQENVQLGEVVFVDATPERFGRVAAQTARQVIQQKIREAERNIQFNFYEKQLGEIVNGVIQALGAHGLTIGLELKAEGLMPRKEMIPYERFRIHDRIRALVAEVKESPRGPQIILSRTHRDFLRRLLENEVPEIFHGIVEIRSIAREPGHRAKVAVSAAQQGIDPVGACVGQRGVRIQAIVRELHDEKIDVIEWNKEPTTFIAKAISPARVNGVYLNITPGSGKTALVVVPEDQLSLAIGRDGQNARLAAKLTGWRIDIKSLPETVSDWLFTLQNNKEYADLAKELKAKTRQVEDIMTRKSEGRVINHEDHDVLTQFMDQLEREKMNRQLAVKQILEQKREDVKKSLPEGAFIFNLAESGLGKKIIDSLGEAKITNAGQLALYSKLEPEKVLELPGIGPKSLEKIEIFIDTLPEIVPQVIEVLEVEISAEKEYAEEAVRDEEKAAESETAQIEDEKVMETAIPEIKEEVQVKAEVVAEEPVSEEMKEIAEKDKKEKEKVSFEEIFALRPEVIEDKSIQEEELVDDKRLEPLQKDKKKKKQKRKFHEIEYDPELDLTIVHKKHKRGQPDWGLKD